MTTEADEPKTYAELVALWPNMPEQEEPWEFNDEDVPSELRSLIPYARIWGLPDDGYRIARLEQTPADLRAHMENVVFAMNKELDVWLCGPEAQHQTFSPAFSAFVALTMAADSF